MLGKILFSSVFAMFIFGCASTPPKVKDLEVFSKNDEFDKVVQITAAPEASASAPSAALPVSETVNAAGKTVGKNKKSVKTKRKVKNGKVKEVVLTHRPPDLEDDEGFDGVSRRPLKDPFNVGEVVTHNVHYNLLALDAGKLSWKVLPFVQVNGNKAYQFGAELTTYPVFSKLFYKVEDQAVSLMDYFDLTPRVYTLHIKESAQLKEVRNFFDFNSLKAKYWEKKVRDKGEVEEKKQEWAILPFSQDILSSLYYVRFFKWTLGKEYSFRVADDNENLVFKGKAIRREVLKTDAGEFKSIVIQPQITVKGIFKPMGDIFIWLSDDEHKYILRIELKIKVGTIISQVISIEPGQPNP